MPNPKHLTERIFQGPQKYIQGPNAIKNSGQYLKALGKKPLLTVDDNVYEIGMYSSRYTTFDTHLWVSWKEPHRCA